MMTPFSCSPFSAFCKSPDENGDEKAFVRKINGNECGCSVSMCNGMSENDVRCVRRCSAACELGIVVEHETAVSRCA